MTTELIKLDRNLQRNFACGGTAGWRRVVYLDMTDLNTNCPSGWQLTEHLNTTCGRVSTGRLTCDSVTFPVSGGDYTRVCGRIKAYQYGWPDAFEAYHNGGVTTINGSYVSGVSLMLLLILPSHHLWVETISVNQESTQGLQLPDYIQTILSGMVRAVLPAVHVAHSTILHISLSNSPALPLMI